MTSTSAWRTFWRTAVPFGVAMAAFRIGKFPLPYALGIGLLMGALFGGITAWQHRRLEHRLLALGIDPSDMEPIQERSVTVVGHESEVHAGCRRALLRLSKVTLVKDNALTGEIEAKTGTTWRSFGERISIRISGSGSRCNVHIVTKPRLDTTVADAGKGVENVALFLRYLESEGLGRSPNQALNVDAPQSGSPVS